MTTESKTFTVKVQGSPAPKPSPSTKSDIVPKTEVASSPISAVGLTEPVIMKMVEYGGAIALVLTLSFLIWMMTNLVRVAKED